MIMDLIHRYTAGKITIRDIAHRKWAELSDTTEKKLRILEPSAMFLGISPAEALVDATTHKSVFYERWLSTIRDRGLDDVAQAALYDEFTYYLTMLPYSHRHKSFHFLSRPLPLGGSMLEYGCGTAIPTEWLLARRPDTYFTVADIPSRTLEFVKFKFKKNSRVTYAEIPPGGVAALSKRYDVIVCLDVLEHTPNPVEIARLLARHLKPGGRLFVDFLAYENIQPGSACNLYCAQQQRGEAIQVFNEQLIPVRAMDALGAASYWGVYTK